MLIMCTINKVYKCPVTLAVATHCNKTNKQGITGTEKVTVLRGTKHSMALLLITWAAPMMTRLAISLLM